MTQTKSAVLSILIPCYNEARTIANVIEKVRSVPFDVPVELIVVDDGSTDGSREILAGLPKIENLKVVLHEKNQGKGAAIQTALTHARGEYIVIQDADEELNPNDLISLFEVVRRGGAPVCYGSRFAGDVRHLRGLPTYWANKMLNGLCNTLNGIRLTDFNTCYKMMRTDLARSLNIQSRGFALEPEITTKLARLGVDIVEEPIHYQPRAKSDGKKIRPRDFFRYINAMVRYRFAPIEAWAPDRGKFRS